YRYAVTGHHERLALIESSHDLSTVVSQLSLGDLSGHTASVAQRATKCAEPRIEAGSLHSTSNAPVAIRTPRARVESPRQSKTGPKARPCAGVRSSDGCSDRRTGCSAPPTTTTQRGVSDPQC